MIVNATMTHYHKHYNKTTRLNEWIRFNYENVMWQGGKGSSTNKGYENANDVSVRLPYSLNTLSISNFAIGDIIVKGTLEQNITAQTDLTVNDVYNITAFKDNNFGKTDIQHIHISGK